jgi:hypothetical protein
LLEEIALPKLLPGRGGHRILNDERGRRRCCFGGPFRCWDGFLRRNCCRWRVSGLVRKPVNGQVGGRTLRFGRRFTRGGRWRGGRWGGAWPVLKQLRHFGIAVAPLDGCHQLGAQTGGGGVIDRLIVGRRRSTGGRDKAKQVGRSDGGPRLGRFRLRPLLRERRLTRD